MRDGTEQADRRLSVALSEGDSYGGAYLAGWNCQRGCVVSFLLSDGLGDSDSGAFQDNRFPLHQHGGVSLSSGTGGSYRIGCD